MLFPHTLEAKKMKTHMHTIVGENCWCELFDLKNPNTKFVSQQRVEKSFPQKHHTTQTRYSKNVTHNAKLNVNLQIQTKKMLQYLLQLQHNVYKEEQGRKIYGKWQEKGNKKDKWRKGGGRKKGFFFL